ncbi:mechanosensitive ion channel [Henriciella marina]|uniref:Small-conductance mechanosensitive channel n=1 Tax=Henriciella marina TaxID=453851 RepID=A0ABT4LRA7_9PROT|nr:mechanosensitive ion channel [Henriciella marina]MCZ4296907.1 mechanosensitive ion channel [Henriciella marina]
MEEFWNNTVTQVQDYGPKVLFALLILIGAYIIGFLFKWAISTAVNKTGFGKGQADPDGKATKSLGDSLGIAAFWIIMLIGVIQALTRLELTQIVQPLNGMLSDVLNYLPNIFGAILIFIVFVIVANVVQKTVKAVFVFADPVPERLGLADGPVNISGVTATVLAAIVGILGAIAAFDVLAIDAISVPATAMLNEIIGAIPNILIAAILLTVFVIIGRFVHNLILRTLPNFGVDSAVAELGILKGADSGMTASNVIAKGALFFIVLLGLVQAMRALEFEVLTNATYTVLDLAASIVFGAIIIFAGVVIARIVSGAMASSGDGASDTVAKVMKWAIIILATILGISRMELDPTGGEFVLNVAEMLVMGAAIGLAIACGIGFGWGGREWFAKQLEKWSRKDGTP